MIDSGGATEAVYLREKVLVQKEAANATDDVAARGVPGHPDVYANGDAAAVPDPTEPTDGNGQRPLCPPRAQHAMRQARTAADWVIGGKRPDDVSLPLLPRPAALTTNAEIEQD